MLGDRFAGCVSPLLQLSLFTPFLRFLDDPVDDADQCDQQNYDELLHLGYLANSHQLPCVGLSGPAIESRMPVSDWMFFIFK